MLSFEQARSLLLSRLTPLEAEAVEVAEADGRVLSEDVLSPCDLPTFSASAMDGYALAAAELGASAPFELAVVGESRAGQPATPLVAGTAQRISTGAELPLGADSVVPQEQVTRTGDRVLLEQLPRVGQHVRLRGEDLGVGQLGLARGTRLHPAALGLLSALDRGQVQVAKRPRVRLLCTGDELRQPGTPALPGQIPDSISSGLAALCRRTGASVAPVQTSGDDREATARAVASGLVGIDLLVTVGGVSVGDHDWVRPALAEQGVELEFWKVAIKPGKPLAFGRAPGGAWVLGLPGNPASALITFALFGVPLLRALQGDAAPLPRPFRLPLAGPIRHKAGRLEFVRAQLDFSGETPAVLPLANQASGALTSLAQADALVCVPAEVEDLPSGASVELLRWHDL